MVFLGCSLQSKECLNKPNLLQRKLHKFSGNIQICFWQLLPATCDATLRRLSQMDKKFFVKSQRKSNQHQEKLEMKKKSQSKQTFLQLDQVNSKEQVISSADISLYELNHLSLKSLFATMGKVLPSETTARACVVKLTSQKEEQCQKLLTKKCL